MAVLTPIYGSSVVLGATETTIFTAAEDTLSILLRLTNTTAASKTVDLYVRHAAAAAADSNTHLKAYAIPANDYLDIQVGNLAATGIVSGLASAVTSVTAAVLSGAERT